MNIFGAFLLEASASASASTVTNQPAAGNNWWALLVFPVVMFGALWLFAIRPQKKREKESAAMQNSLDIGDMIITIGGMTGRILSVNDAEDEIIIETGSNKSRISIKRWAIQSKLKEDGSPVDAKDSK